MLTEESDAEFTVFSYQYWGGTNEVRLLFFFSVSSRARSYEVNLVFQILNVFIMRTG